MRCHVEQRVLFYSVRYAPVKRGYVPPYLDAVVPIMKSLPGVTLSHVR